MKVFVAALAVVLLVACSDSTEPEVVSLAGSWSLSGGVGGSIAFSDVAMSADARADTLAHWMAFGDTIVVDGFAGGPATVVSGGQTWAAECGAMLYRSWPRGAFEPDTNNVLSVGCYQPGGGHHFSGFASRSTRFPTPVTTAALTVETYSAPGSSPAVITLTRIP